MRNEVELKERIRMALVEDMQNISTVLQEPENQFSQFLENIVNHLYEIYMDEITYRKRY